MRREPCVGDLLIGRRSRGLEGSFCHQPSNRRSALRCAPSTDRKNASAITGDILAKLPTSCAAEYLTALRDQAIQMVAFASGGRRRSESASLRTEQLIRQPPLTDKHGSPLLASISDVPKPPIRTKWFTLPGGLSEPSPVSWKRHSPAIAPCSRRLTTITMQNGAADGRHGCFECVCRRWRNRR